MEEQRKEREGDVEEINKRQRYSAPEPSQRGEKRVTFEDELFEDDDEGDKDMEPEVEEDVEVVEGKRRKQNAVMIGQVRVIAEIQKMTPSPHDEGELEDLECFEGADDDVEVKFPKLVKEAREEEVEYIEKIPVYDVVDETEAWEVTGKGPISGKWVDINKQDDDNPLIRCRYVARDFKPVGEKDREDLFADMPPLEAKRFLLRMAKVEDVRNGKPR